MDDTFIKLFNAYQHTYCPKNIYFFKFKYLKNINI